MRTSCTFTLTWPFAVLAAGLISCSSDKKAEIKQDTWPMPDMAVLSKDGVVTSELRAVEHTVQSTDSVEFKFTDPKHDNSIKKLSAKSECSPLNSKESFVSKYSIQDSPRFRFMDSLSNELLIRNDTKLNCTFKMVIENEISSTKTFELIRLTIDRTKEEKVLLLGGLDRQPVTAAIQSSAFENIRLYSPIDVGDLELICRHFKTTLNNKRLSDVRLSDLVNQTLNLDLKIDTRRQHPVQTCRILMRDKSPARTVVVSSEFSIDFGPHKLEISVNEVTRTSPSNRLLIARGRIKNPNPYPVSMTWTASAGDLSLTQVFRLENSDYGHTTEVRTGKLSVQIEASHQSFGGANIVTLHPGNTVEFGVYADMSQPLCTKPIHYIGTGRFPMSLVGAHISAQSRNIYFETSAEPASSETPFKSHGRVDVTRQFPDAFYQSWDGLAVPTKPLDLKLFACMPN